METKTTTTEQSNVNVKTSSINTVFRSDSIKVGVLRALTILGALTIIYIGGYLLIQGVKRLPEVRTYLASVFLSSKEVRATSTPSIIGTTTVTHTGGTTTSTTTKPSTGTYTPPIATSPIPGITTTNVYPGTTGAIVSNPNGKPDLAVVMLSYGILNKTTDVYTATTSPVNRVDRIAVRFEVINKGDKTSPSWRFNGILPTNPARTFNSDEQPVINPGDKIVYTLGFEQMQDQATSTVRVDIDPSGLVIESDEYNNNASVSIGRYRY